MPVNSRLQTTKIIGQRKVFYRQRIPEFSCARKETVDTEKFSANNFSLSEAEDNTSRPLNRWFRFTFVEITISILSKLKRAKFLESNSFVLLAYASLVAPRALSQ